MKIYKQLLTYLLLPSLFLFGCKKEESEKQGQGDGQDSKDSKTNGFLSMSDFSFKNAAKVSKEDLIEKINSSRFIANDDEDEEDDNCTAKKLNKLAIIATKDDVVVDSL